MEALPNFEDFLKKVEKLRKEGGVDLSVAEDLSLAVMNLISLEEHFFFTGAKTGKEEYYDRVTDIREMRKKLLAKLMPNHEGETWCASKHLLSASMRLIETANRFQAEGKKAEAKIFYEDAYKIYSIFWGLKLKLLDVRKVVEPGSGKPMTFEDLVTKLADCCSEKKYIWIAIVVFVAVLGAAFFIGKKDESRAGELDGFAQCLTEKGAVMYGTYWCSHCLNQKKMFGSSFKYIDYVECTEDTTRCASAKIEGTPTWTFADGARIVGETSLEKLAELTSCSLPEK